MAHLLPLNLPNQLFSVSPSFLVVAHTLLLNNAGRNADLTSLGSKTSKTSAGGAGCLRLPTDCEKGESVQKADPGVASRGYN